MADIDLLIASLDGVKQTSSKQGHRRYMALCPSHSDKGASLSIRETGDRVLIHCFAGCSAAGILESLGLDFGVIQPVTENYKPLFRKTIDEEYAIAESMLELLPHTLANGVRLSEKDKRDIINAKILIARRNKLWEDG